MRLNQLNRALWPKCQSSLTSKKQCVSFPSAKAGRFPCLPVRQVRGIQICLSVGLLLSAIPLVAMAKDKNPPVEEPTSAAPKDKTFLFLGSVNSDNINVRCDSTVTAKVICTADKGERVQVINESYEWYKIRLPKKAPSFIKKDLVEIIDEKTAKVAKDNVNIRLSPNGQSSVLGSAGKNEIISILGENGEWYEITPIANSYGWVNKQFVDKALSFDSKEKALLSREAKNKGELTRKESVSPQEGMTVEGIIMPYGKVLRRTANHKLIANDNKVFLLKGDKENLDSLNYRKVKITGKATQPQGQKYISIEIEKIEALD